MPTTPGVSRSPCYSWSVRFGGILFAILGATLNGCGGDDSPKLVADPPAEPTPEQVTATSPEYSPGTRSLELTRTAPVRLDAGDDGKRIGTIAVDTRVAWTRTAKAKGCQRP